MWIRSSSSSGARVKSAASKGSCQVPTSSQSSLEARSADERCEPAICGYGSCGWSSSYSWLETVSEYLLSAPTNSQLPNFIISETTRGRRLRTRENEEAIPEGTKVMHLIHNYDRDPKWSGSTNKSIFFYSIDIESYCWLLIFHLIKQPRLQLLFFLFLRLLTNWRFVGSGF